MPETKPIPTTTARYAHLGEYADAIDAQGPHEARVAGKLWRCVIDGGPVIVPVLGGQGFVLADLAPGTPTRVAVERTAAHREARRNAVRAGW